ncbi:MAG: DUF2065 domain-containing protein [Desulfobacteraceae bacterium]|nr:MAG: DUF2065 domain-containing protein [Desulfobacteraceae bacterium]
MKFFFCVMGMVMIVEGLPYFAFPQKMKEMMTMILGFPDSALRRFGFILMLAGLGIVYVTIGRT